MRIVDRISKAELCLISVLVHKPSLQEPERFQGRYRLYFYTVRYLFERVSWYCRDHRTPQDTGDGSAEIIFSNRAGMSYQEMRDYMGLLRARTGFFDVRIEWSIIRPEQVTVYSPGRRMGLQIADAVASSFYYAVQASAYGFTEDRYARMLKPVVYHRRERYLGYGLKFFPREVNAMLGTEEGFEWLRREYNFQ